MSMRTAETTDYLANGTDTGIDQTPNGTAVSDDSFSVIDQYSNFDGTFRANRDLRIDGEVKGTIECQGTLHIAQGATVTAKVEAENIAVAGDFNGDIRCRGRLQIMPSGRVQGKVTTETLVVNEGAFYEGELEMTRGGERIAPSTSHNKPGPVPIPSQSAEGRSGRSSGPAQGGTSDIPGAPSNTFIRRFGGPETPWDSRSPQEEEAQAAAEDTNSSREN